VHIGEISSLELDEKKATELGANMTRFWQLVNGSTYAITLTNPNSRVLIVEFLDPLCPHCIAMFSKVGDKILELYKNGTASIVLIYSPTATWSFAQRLSSSYAVMSLRIWDSVRSSGDALGELIRIMKTLELRLKRGEFPKPPNATDYEIARALVRLKEADDFATSVADSLGIKFRGTPTTVIIFLDKEMD